MIRIHLRLALLFVAISIPMPYALAQVVTGAPPFSSVTPSNFDQVNSANLNVMFSVPIVSKPGRGGMNLNYSLGYNSSVWNPYNVYGSHTWTPAANWGWGQASSANPGSISYDSGIAYCTDYYENEYSYSYLTLYTYYDSSGAPHPIGSAGTGALVSGRVPTPPPAALATLRAPLRHCLTDRG